MDYEYTIKCLVCGYTIAVGDLVVPASLGAGDIQAKALHNPGCPIPPNIATNNTEGIQHSVGSNIVIGSSTITPYTINFVG